MMRSLSSGVAGLKAHQTKMDVIGNNIANVNTVGYKAQRVTVKDSFYQTLSSATDSSTMSGGTNAAQVGYGSAVSTIDVLHTNGGINTTGNAMDLYIQGNGYFVVDDGKGNKMYTRVGVLSFDGDGNLVDGNGNYVLGYPMARYYENQDPKAGTITVDDITINFGAENASCFNGYRIRTVTDPAATGVTAEANIGDKIITVTSAGAVDATALQTALQSMTETNGVLPTMVDISLITVEGTGTLTENKLSYTSVTGGDTAKHTGDLVFDVVPAKPATLSINGVEFNFGDTNGGFFNGYRVQTVQDVNATGVSAEIDLTNKVMVVTTNGTTISASDMEAALKTMTTKPGTGILPDFVNTGLISVIGKTATLLDTGLTTVTAVGGADISQTTSLDVSNGLQRISKCGALMDTDGDGVYDTEAGTVAELTGIRIAENGIITGEDANGVIFNLGQIATANVANPSALYYDGNGYLTAQENVGEVTYGVPGEGSLGLIISGALETSNVDLAGEFSDMIITQRGFQANSRIITVSDTLLEELINLKR